MILADFLALYRAFWPSARDLDGEGYQALWREVVEFVPADGVARALRHIRQTAPFAPTIATFRAVTDDKVEAWARTAARHGDADAAAWLARFRPIACPGACGKRWDNTPEGRGAAERHDCPGLRQLRLERLGPERVRQIDALCAQAGAVPPRRRRRELRRSEIPDLDGGVSAGGA